MRNILLFAALGLLALVATAHAAGKFHVTPGSRDQPRAVQVVSNLGW